MSTVVDCTPLYLLYVAMRLPQRDVDEALALGYTDMQHLAVQRAAELGVRWAVIDNEGRPRACFGITEMAVPGVGALWLLRTENAGAFVKTGFKALKAILATRTYRRIEALARSDCKPCQKLLEWLGFKHEGTKQQYFIDGCSVEMYAFTQG